jgi:p-aminobenzoyl-glutamate transporter AbgT
MELTNMGQRAYRITSFVTVQLIALVGWIIVQSLFSLSPISSSLSFTAKMIIEAIWWIATLVIMFLLFRRVYNGFVKAVLDLEDANKRLRKATNDLLIEIANPSEQEQ